MATVVETPWAKIFIDPGASYAPRRYGLPPHPIELERLEKSLEVIERELADSDVVVVTHYHYDHYLYRSEQVELYRGKTLLVKHPTNNINLSQRIRAHRFLKNLSNLESVKLEYADSRRFSLSRNLVLEFSSPVPHGAPGTKLGWVLMVLINVEGYKVVHASDVQGPISSEAMNIILEWRPNVVYLSGPPTYFEDFKVPKEHVEQGFKNLLELSAHVPLVVVDHHFARDLRFTDYLVDLNAMARGTLVCAATYMGFEPEPLEAMRKKLWRQGAST